ncbi:MAG: hypothetical protein CL885_05080 [Dehalococcoidia bacterium]|nr:hypothetical protein [Dehalococcoidia bacterium]
MNLLGEYIRELLIEQTQDLEQVVWQFRKEMESKMGWDSNQGCFANQCHRMTRPLVKRLKEAGFDAHEVEGTYYGASDEFVAAHEEHDGGYGEFFHWWIELDGKIIDVTADQFHPGRESAYRVVIVDKWDTDDYGR